MLGFMDDRSDLSPGIRFPIQILLVGTMVALAGPFQPLVIGPLELTGWPLAAGLALAGLWWINLFNFMDGIDGIAASQALLVLLSSTLIAVLSGHPPLLAVVILVAATSGFLVRNWPPARIFMGDVGSNFLAFAILAVALLDRGNRDINYPMWLILTSPFVADATITLIVRTINGEKPWRAHNRHTYQRLARRVGHLKVTLIYGAVTALWAAPLAIYASINPAIAWWLVLVTYMPIAGLVIWAGAGSRNERTY